MTTSSTPKFKKLNDSDPDSKKIVSLTMNPIDLSSDPDYPRLVDFYQNAQFEECEKLLDELEKKYPKNSQLRKFKDDIRLKLSLKIMVNENLKEEKRTKQKKKFNLSVFTVFSVLIIIVVFFFSFKIFAGVVAARRLETETAQLASLSNQVEQLLLAGQAQPAAEIVSMMISVNPEYEQLSELKSQTDTLLRLEANYQTALDLINENKNSEALLILKDIEKERPGLWDVSFRITSMETIIQVAKFMEDGNAAYQSEAWDQVISAYEAAMTLDPKLDDPLMKEQLLNAYLKVIISTLQNENTSFDDVEKAERYYRNAIAMIPQNKAFAGERENLQEISSNLLEFKLTQNARSILADKRQTTSSIAKAVSYLSQAAKLKPKNAILQLDLKNAQYYQTSFQNFVDMDWVSSINNLKQIVSADPNYADGNARQLLYEAYYALGKQYFSQSFYLDARTNLEQAEILAWDDSENLMKLFQVQVLLGDVIGTMNDYQNAVSYYKYALEVIKLPQNIAKYPALEPKYKEANDWLTAGNFKNSFAAFQEVLQGVDVAFLNSEFEIRDGACLALFAAESVSTMDAIIEANNLPHIVVIAFGRKLKVPSIEK